MKNLEALNQSSLLNLEYGQHIKTIHQNITTKVAITDTILAAYLQSLETNSDAYDRAMVYIAKSDETAKIVAADFVRDHACAALNASIAPYEFSKNPAKKEAYSSLRTLFDGYSGLPQWNYERESNGITNLLADLNSSKYAPHAELLGIFQFAEELEIAETAFKLLFDGRTNETVEKEIFDVKLLRKNMMVAYNDLTEYVLTMAKAKSTQPEYDKALAHINTVRKYYADMIARRKDDEEIAPLSA